VKESILDCLWGKMSGFSGGSGSSNGGVAIGMAFALHDNTGVNGWIVDQRKRFDWSG